jgi:hypothetical protein
MDSTRANVANAEPTPKIPTVNPNAAAVLMFINQLLFFRKSNSLSPISQAKNKQKGLETGVSSPFVMLE